MTLLCDVVATFPPLSRKTCTMKPKMKVIKSPRLDAEEASAGGETSSLSLEELLALVKTKGTIQEREQVVIDNLKSKGLTESILRRKME